MKKQMNKSITIFMALFLIFCICLSSCGQKTETSKKKTTKNTSKQAVTSSDVQNVESEVTESEEEEDTDSEEENYTQLANSDTSYIEQGEKTVAISKEDITAILGQSPYINVKNPPKDSGLSPVTGEGTEDETEKIQKIIDYAADNGYGTVYFPKPSSAYQCDFSVKVPIDKISVVGENSLFNFGNNTDRYCFQLQCNSSYAERPTHKNVFMGVRINDFDTNGQKAIESTGIYIDGKDLPDGYFSQDNFTIDRCSVVRCLKGIEFGTHAWRTRIVDSLFLWNTYHIYQFNTQDTGEDIHFDGCMFADGGTVDIAVPIEVNFTNCSLDNIEMYFRYGCNAFFNQCHIEYGKGGKIKAPIITLCNNNVNVTMDQTVMVVNSNVFEVSPIAIQNGTMFAGLQLNKCMLPLDRRYYDTAAFGANKMPVQFVSGKGKVLASGTYGFGSESCDVPISESLSPYSDSDFETANNTQIFANTYPLQLDKTLTTAAHPLHIINTQSYRDGRCLELEARAGENIYSYIDVNAQPMQTVSMSLPYYITQGTGKLVVSLEYLRSDGVVMQSQTYSGIKSYGEYTIKDGWDVILMGNICPAGTEKVRVNIQLLGGTDITYCCLDAFLINVI